MQQMDDKIGIGFFRRYQASCPVCRQALMNGFCHHGRQTCPFVSVIYLILFLQYIHPSDSHKLGQAELVCIDEAAAIPLPLVKNLLGPYLVFMSSTVNG